MSAPSPIRRDLNTFARREPVITFFVLAFAVSWTGALAVAAPYLIRHQPIGTMTGIAMFPVMLFGPCLAGIALTRVTDGKQGVRNLFRQMARTKVSARWY